MADTHIPVDSSTRERLKGHMRGQESYDAFLNAFMDYLEGTSVNLPWPRLPRAAWEAIKQAAQVEVKL